MQGGTTTLSMFSLTLRYTRNLFSSGGVSGNTSFIIASAVRFGPVFLSIVCTAGASRWSTMWVGARVRVVLFPLSGGSIHFTCTNPIVDPTDRCARHLKFVLECVIVF